MSTVPGPSRNNADRALRFVSTPPGEPAGPRPAACASIAPRAHVAPAPRRADPALPVSGAAVSQADGDA